MFIRLFIDALSLGYGNHECDGYHAMEIPTMDICCKRFAEHKCTDNNGRDGFEDARTDALVAPMFREAIARVAVETMVGNRASPTRLSQSAPVVIPAVMAVSELMIFPRNTIAPTVSA